jgi:Xaa-Pro dipeptidase
MELIDLFQQHIAERQASTAQALSQTGFETLVISSGAPLTYFADDHEAPFWPTPHFAHWCPMRGPHHILKVEPGRKPLLIRYAPLDYWYEQRPLGTPFWLDGFELVEVRSVETAWDAIGRPTRAAYIGNETGRAEAAGLAANPPNLTARLDWARSYKSDYEIRCLEEATALAARGHEAAAAAFLAGGSEIEIHHAFVAGMGVADAELPYGTIVALDEKGATLHYEGKRSARGGKVLLIDAGVCVRGYAADITRTHTTPACEAGFVDLVSGMEKLELELCEATRPGLAYTELHLRAHHAIGALLVEQGLLKAKPQEAVEEGWTSPFFPHGLGHHLGLQVHDVAGKQSDPEGNPAPPPEGHAFLRNTRPIEPRQVFTIEPGLYFIPMLLRPFREGSQSARFDWARIDALTPCGGIRIEDNLVVTASGRRNLTREKLPH